MKLIVTFLLHNKYNYYEVNHNFFYYIAKTIMYLFYRIIINLLSNPIEHYII